MSKREEKFIIEGKLRDYEKIIITYYIERANFTGQSDTLATLIGYLSIYRSLTQAQLKELTGFSKSTISTGLSNLVNVRYVKKDKIIGKREYRYYLTFDYQGSIDDALGSVEPEIKFFREKISELKNKFAENYRGYDLLLERLTETIEVFEVYQTSLKRMKFPNEIVKVNYEQPQEKILTARDIDYILDDFDSEIKAFENELIDFFKYQSVYSTLKEFMLIVFVYFITRKVLTQSKIKELTGLSVGKISQVVNNLIKKGHITKLNKAKYKNLIPKKLERQKFYAMITISNSFFLSGINSLKVMLKWESNFVSIKMELNELRNELEKLFGYQKVEKVVNDLVDLMPIYKRAIKEFSRFLL